MAQTTHYRFDDAGRVEAVRNPRGFWTEFTLDVMGRVTETVDPKGNTTLARYDLAGQVTHERDQLGYWYAYTYNLRGWRTENDGMSNLVFTINTIQDVTQMFCGQAGYLFSLTDSADNIIALVVNWRGEPWIQTDSQDGKMLFNYTAQDCFFNRAECEGEKNETSTNPGAWVIVAGAEPGSGREAASHV